MVMNFDIRYVGDYDVSAFLDTVNTFTDSQWDEWQQRKGSNNPHNDVRSIPLKWCLKVPEYHPSLTDEENGLVYGPLYLRCREFLDEIHQIIDSVDGPGKPVTAILANLPAGKTITPHIDTPGLGLFTHCKRYHVVLQTHLDVGFYYNGVRHHMERGTIHELNNTDGQHGVDNPSSVDRIHLITDRSCA